MPQIKSISQDWVQKFFNKGGKMINRITSQKVLKLLMITMTFCSLSYAADISINGTIKDAKGNPLEGVTVTLAENAELSMTTPADGAFILSTGTSILMPKDFSAEYGITIRNHNIVFTAGSQKLSGNIALYSINGKQVVCSALDNLQNGQQRLVLPKLSQGTYVLTGAVNGKSFTRTLYSLGNSLREDNHSRNVAVKPERKGTQRNASSFAAVVDTLVFSKEGYTSQRWPLNSYSRENIRMVLRATGETPVVYFTKELGPAGFVKMYEAIGYDLPGEIMVKVHNGEQDGQYYIKSSRMADLVNQVNGTIVETCLQFSMSGFFRDNPERNLQISKDHGFDTIGQGVDIIDTDGELMLPVVGGSQLGGKCYVGANFANYQSSLVISHFKGHGIAGFGGALKNVGIGFSSPEGKGLIHSAGKTKGTGTSIWDFQNNLGFQKGMVEAVKAVNDALAGNLVYINTVDNLTVECDCDVALGQKAPEMPDIGMVGSLDPVAIDKASYDLVMAAEGGQALKTRISGTSYKGLDGLSYGKTVGLGDTEYELIDIDE